MISLKLYYPPANLVSSAVFWEGRVPQLPYLFLTLSNSWQVQLDSPSCWKTLNKFLCSYKQLVNVSCATLEESAQHQAMNVRCILYNSGLKEAAIQEVVVTIFQ